VVGSRLVERGVLVLVAAGNWGTAGPFFHCSGASGELVLSVASVTATEYPASAFEARFIDANGASNTSKVAYVPDSKGPFPSNLTNVPIFPLSGDQTLDDEACGPLPAGTPNLAGKIVLVRRASACPYGAQQENLEAAGAQWILFYNNDSPVEQPFGWFQSTIGLIEGRAGDAIIKAVKAGGNVTASFTIDPTEIVGMYDPAGGLPSYFSSWGGLYDMQVKPDIAAPGENIFSTFLNGGYTMLSGTSQATPYVAGVAALYVGEFGGRKTQGSDWAKDLTGRIISSGQSVKWSKSGDFWAPTMKVGNGLVDATKLLQYDTSLSFSKFALNDTKHFSRYQSVDVRNGGKSSVTYTFEIQDAAGFEIWQPDDGGVGNPRIKSQATLQNNPVKMVPGIKFPSGTFTVSPGQTKKAE
jgi:subtilisin family serine protease